MAGREDIGRGWRTPIIRVDHPQTGVVKKLVVKGAKISPLDSTSTLEAVSIEGANHDTLASRLSKHLCNSFAIAHQRAALRASLEKECPGLFSVTPLV